MSWLKRDDQRCLHPKIGELTDREYRALDALNEYCARVRNNGYFDASDIRHAVYATPKGGRSVTRRELTKFVAMRLVDRFSTETRPILDQNATETQPKLDLHQIHDWDAYQPKDPTGAERKRLERERKQGYPQDNGLGQSRDSHQTSHADVTPSRARVPVPSRPKEPFLPAVASYEAEAGRQEENFYDEQHIDPLAELTRARNRGDE